MVDFKVGSKESILNFLIQGLDITGIFNKNTIEIFKENFESVFDCYRQHDELTNSDYIVLFSILLNLSRNGKKIKDGKRYADFTVERYFSYFTYYVEWNREHDEKIDPFVMAVTMIRKEILGILENENGAEYEY